MKSNLSFLKRYISPISLIHLLAIPIPFVSQSSVVQDESLSSLSKPTSIRQHIQSACNIDGIPKLEPSNIITSDKISFHPDQHKHHITIPNYYYPRRLSAMEILTKQYLPPVIVPQKSTGLFWYNAQQQLVCLFIRGREYKK